MRIAIIVEGQTERAFLPFLLQYLRPLLAGQGMPKLDVVPFDGRIPTGAKLRQVVQELLADRRRPANHVIALTDVYTGSHPPDFQDAADAKAKMREWVGEEPRFHPHAAQFDFEAWLLPYWTDIQALAGHNMAAPSGNPENVNHLKPPSHRIKEIFRRGNKRSYVKTRDAARILRGQDLEIAIRACKELRALVNTILDACGAPLLK